MMTLIACACLAILAVLGVASAPLPTFDDGHLGLSLLSRGVGHEAEELKGLAEVEVGDAGDGLGSREARREGDETTLRHLLSLSDLPKAGLNNTNDCNNKLCYYLESALSCKALNFNISKICARYFLGYLYGCDAFPPPSQLFNAPSVCIPELLALLPPSAKTALAGIKSSGGKTPDISSLSPSMNHTKAYLASNFHSNCRRTCFQRYISQANDFFDSCNDQLVKYANKTNQNSLYPLVYKLESYSEFRNQVCVQNATGANCYDTLASINPVSHTAKPPINILDPTCNYFSATTSKDWSLNALVLQGVCQKLEVNGCCVANQIAMLAQAQTNSSAGATYNKPTVYSAIKVFPPCLLHYLSSSSCKTDLTDFCHVGANGNLTTITGTIRMDQSGGKMPNVYSLQSILTLQGVISLNLPGFDISRTKQPVLQVEIVDFAYFNTTVANQASKYQLTPADGTTYFPSQGDYAAAQSGLFRFLVVVEGLTQAESDNLYYQLTQVQTCHANNRGAFGTLLAVYGATSNAECVVDAPMPLVQAAPLSLPPKNSASRVAAAGLRDGLVWATCVALVSFVLSLSL